MSALKQQFCKEADLEMVASVIEKDKYIAWLEQKVAELEANMKERMWNTWKQRAKISLGGYYNEDAQRFMFNEWYEHSEYNHTSSSPVEVTDETIKNMVKVYDHNISVMLGTNPIHIGFVIAAYESGLNAMRDLLKEGRKE